MYATPHFECAGGYPSWYLVKAPSQESKKLTEQFAVQNCLRSANCPMKAIMVLKVPFSYNAKVSAWGKEAQLNKYEKEIYIKERAEFFKRDKHGMFMHGKVQPDFDLHQEDDSLTAKEIEDAVQRANKYTARYGPTQKIGCARNTQYAYPMEDIAKPVAVIFIGGYILETRSEERLKYVGVLHT